MQTNIFVGIVAYAKIPTASCSAHRNNIIEYIRIADEVNHTFITPYVPYYDDCMPWVNGSVGIRVSDLESDDHGIQ